MSKQEFLQKAHPYNPKKHLINAKFASEKLDGQRFFWDGGVTRGMKIEQVPWANIKNSNSVPLATGLWSNYAKPINAPDYWLDLLPKFPIEGELWTGYGEYQYVSSIVRANVNVKVESWRDVKAMVLDSPPAAVMFRDRHISRPPHLELTMKGCFEFFKSRGGFELPPGTMFMHRQIWLERNLSENPVVKLHKQVQLPHKTSLALVVFERLFDEALDHQGEGMIVKSGNDLWLPERVHSVLKSKPWLDGEAVVTGYTWGRETDRGSRLLGKMGALICKIPKGSFKVSGFTDEERNLVFTDTNSSAASVGFELPDTVATADIGNLLFPRGSVVTYKYRELTDAGLPKEGRYWRKRDEA